MARGLAVLLATAMAAAGVGVAQESAAQAAKPFWDNPRSQGYAMKVLGETSDYKASVPAKGTTARKPGEGAKWVEYTHTDPTMPDFRVLWFHNDGDKKEYWLVDSLGVENQTPAAAPTPSIPTVMCPSAPALPANRAYVTCPGTTGLRDPGSVLDLDSLRSATAPTPTEDPNVAGYITPSGQKRQRTDDGDGQLDIIVNMTDRTLVDPTGSNGAANFGAFTTAYLDRTETIGNSGFTKADAAITVK